VTSVDFATDWPNQCQSTLNSGDIIDFLVVNTDNVEWERITSTVDTSFDSVVSEGIMSMGSTSHQKP
jgi:hypothetical protein